MALQRTPEQGVVSADMGRIDATIESLHRLIDESELDQLRDIYERAGALGKKAWVIQAHCLFVAKARKIHANDGAIKDVAVGFGLSQSQASAMIRVWEAYGRDFEDMDGPYDRLVGVSWYKTGAYTREPKRWIEHAARQVEADPGYRIADFRDDIARARASETPREDTALRAVAREGGQDADRLRQRLAEYRLLWDALNEAARGTNPLIYQTSPEELARALGPLRDDEAADLQVIDSLAKWLARVTEARRALTAGHAGRREASGR